MYSVMDENVIKVHTADDGRVWYAIGINPPVNSEQIVDTFLLSSVITKFGTIVRLLGTAQNAELIASLYLRQYKGEIRSVEVAGPNILQSPAEFSDPALVILRMRAVSIASAAGGWHALSMHDYPTYAMLARMWRTNFAFDMAMQTYWRMHPAHKALTFIPTISEEETVKLLTTIIDPRWYVDRRTPDRAAKLELYLGLTPQVQNRVSDIKKLLSKRREVRNANVLAAWKTQPVDNVDLQLPGNFLYRIHAAAGGGIRGDLRGSQAFIRFLRYNWLAGLENRVGKKDGLFAPNLFFKSPAECSAYTQHMESTDDTCKK